MGEPVTTVVHLKPRPRQPFSCCRRLLRSPLAGVYCAFLASIASPLTYLTAAMIDGATTSPITVFLVRSLQHVSLFGVLVAKDEQWSTFFPPGELALLLIRAVFQSMSLVTCYVALTMLPTADVYAVSSSYPLFATVGGYLFLKESFGWAQGIGAMATVVGAVFVSRPEFLFGAAEVIEGSQNNSANDGVWAGTLLSALSCLFQAAAILLSRKIRHSTTPTVMVYSGFVAASGAAAYVMIAGDWRFPRCGVEALLVIGGGATSMLTNALTFYAGKLIKAGRLSVIRSSSILFTYVLQVVLMGVVPQWHSLVGASLILVSLLLTTVKIRRGCTSAPPQLQLELQDSDEMTEFGDKVYLEVQHHDIHAASVAEGTAEAPLVTKRRNRPESLL